ncbi:ATP-binding protein [Tabrizicola caldifontis]|uniref:ATP-binding protein n=1 Tax=Tabrizicola caldifontis TaxID=2528036 RepID=UPI00107FE3C6|nr:ATP-binding protein [Rhodobacter sp. YIM 73028]
MPPAPEPCARDGPHGVVIRAEPTSVRAALRSILAAPPVSEIAPRHRQTVELVLAEVLNNVAEHAYAPATGHVAIFLMRFSGGLVCEVIDNGAPMPNGTAPAGRLPEFDLSGGDLPEGGFGWYLIRSLACEITYRRQRGTNRLGFTIPLGPPVPQASDP